MAQPPTMKERKIIEAMLRLIYRHGYRKVTMSDIAEEAEMSRPSLYASFENKEAVLNGLMKSQSAAHEIETQQQLAGVTTLRERLDRIFEIWMIEPFASVVGSENGLDLLSNIETYAPKAVTDFYSEFEAHLLAMLKSEPIPDGSMAPEDIAHILMLAMKGLKTSVATVPEFRRMTSGLIDMAVAAIGSSKVAH